MEQELHRYNDWAVLIDDQAARSKAGWTLEHIAAAYDGRAGAMTWTVVWSRPPRTRTAPPKP